MTLSSPTESMQCNGEAENEVASYERPTPTPQSSLYRTNTFPRSRDRRKMTRRQTSQVAADRNESLPLDALVIASPSDDVQQHHFGSAKGFRRGLSEQMQRIGRGTLDRLQRVNRARKLAGA